MADNVALSPKKRRAIAALLTARTVEEAAQAANISSRTVWRWIREPDFSQAMRQAENEAIGAAVRALVGDLVANFATMRAARDDTTEPAAVRLRAAQALDNSALRWIELRELTDRISRLEAALYGIHDSNSTY